MGLLLDSMVCSLILKGLNYKFISKTKFQFFYTSYFHYAFDVTQKVCCCYFFKFRDMDGRRDYGMRGQRYDSPPPRAGPRRDYDSMPPSRGYGMILMKQSGFSLAASDFVSFWDIMS